VGWGEDGRPSGGTGAFYTSGGRDCIRLDGDGATIPSTWYCMS
jgi:hypothetical protein